MRIINVGKLEANIEKYAQEFHTALPFSHIVIEDFLNVEAAEEILACYPSIDQIRWDNEKTYKHQYKKYQKNVLEGFGVDPFFKESADPRFLSILSRITGIDDLKPDPDLFGAGLHQIESGGFLDVHVDFNIHEKTQCYRRLNLLVYLNKDWKPEYQGYLELWDMNKRKCVKSIAPMFNCAVLFETSEISFHGHPKPLRTPPGVTRKSLSVYYYTEQMGPRVSPESHNTLYRNTEGLSGALKVLRSTLVAGVERINDRLKRH